MTDLEKAEKLREKADVSFAEAKEALDKSGGDLLDALIYLEEQGKATVPAGGGFFSGADTPVETEKSSKSSTENESDKHSGETFSTMMKKLGRFLIKMFNKGNSNYLEARKGDEHLFSCPVTVLVLLLIFFFWVTVPLLVISAFCGFQYRFSGKDLGKDSVNKVMDDASNAVDEVKKSFAESADKAADKKEKKSKEKEKISEDEDE